MGIWIAMDWWLILNIIRILVAISILGFASYYDIKTRLVSNKFWIILGLIAISLLECQIILEFEFDSFQYLVFTIYRIIVSIFRPNSIINLLLILNFYFGRLFCLMEKTLNTAVSSLAEKWKFGYGSIFNELAVSFLQLLPRNSCIFALSLAINQTSFITYTSLKMLIINKI